MKTYFAAAAVALTTAAPALAAPFDGPFVGVEVGQDGYEVKADDVTIDGDTLSADGLSANGAALGVYAGYDIRFGSAFFAGIEANAQLSDAGLSADLGVDGSGKIEAKEGFGLSARFGGVVAQDVGLYARVGWQNTKFKATISDGVDTLKGSDRKDAFVYGGGLEAAVSKSLSLRAEYLIEDYGSAGLNKAASELLEQDVNGLHVDNYKVSLGLSYRF